MASKYQISHHESWYNVTPSGFVQYGGYYLLRKYNGSLSQLLTTVYPEYRSYVDNDLHSVLYYSNFRYKWDLLKFTSSSASWNTFSHQRTFMDNLAESLSITDQEGWYQLSASTLESNGGTQLLDTFGGSLYKLLSTVYPEYQIRAGSSHPHQIPQ